MSKSIENAVEIIEKFGGIRPMSTKINVAVTTIQGWKKRGVIPAARKDIILKAALEHEIDLSAFFDDAPQIGDDSDSSKSTDNVVAIEDEGKKQDQDKEKQDRIIEKPDKSDANAKGGNNVGYAKKIDEFSPRHGLSGDRNFTEIVVETQKRAVTKSAVISVLVVLFIIAALIVMLLPDFKEFGKRGNRLSAIEKDISEIRDMQSSFKGLVPENWSKQLSDLKRQIEQAKDAAGNAMDSVKEVSKDMMAAEGLEQRVLKLQTYVSEITNDSGMYALLSRFEVMGKGGAGKNILDNSVLELSSLFENMKDKDDSYVNNALDMARSQSKSLQQTLGNVPQSELKAAAMLLALTQVRSALNRSDEAFDSDLALLMNMIGEDNVELRASLEKLSPQAKTGVLSASGLQSEFRTIAGDVVAASLKGEDVSFSQKAAARMNEILRIEKNGELITGTKTQATVQKADKMMQEGNLDAALKYLKSNLNAKELEPLRPWIKKAEAVLTSAKVKRAINQAIELNVGRGYLGGSQLLNSEE